MYAMKRVLPTRQSAGLFCLLIASVVLPLSPARANDRQTATVSNIFNLATTNAEVKLGDWLVAEAKGLSVSQQELAGHPDKVLLFLNDLPFTGLCTAAFAQTNGDARFIFHLERPSNLQTNWVALLGSPTGWSRPVTVNVGFDDGSFPFNAWTNSLTLTIIPHEPLWHLQSSLPYIVGILIFLGCLIALGHFGGRKKLKRKAYQTSHSKEAEQEMKRLTRYQTGVWSLLVVGCFVCFGPFWGWVVVLILFLGGFWRLATHSEMLRDSGQDPPDGKFRPYSLAKVQMALWFFWVINAYIFIWVTSSALDTITTTVLALIGIGAGTALGASAQDGNKFDALVAEKADLEQKATRLPADEDRLKTLEGLLAETSQLQEDKKRLESLVSSSSVVASPPPTPAASSSAASPAPAATAPTATPPPPTPAVAPATVPLPPPCLQHRLAGMDACQQLHEITKILQSRASQDFFQDVLTDDVGISFHRFQMFVWTIVLGIIFITEVYRNLAMPDFSATLLALMGISSGTYMGFMLTEPHSSEQVKQ